MKIIPLLVVSTTMLTGCFTLSDAEFREQMKHYRLEKCLERNHMLKVRTPKQIVLSTYDEAYLYAIQRNIKKGIYSPMYFVMPFAGKVALNKQGLPSHSLGKGSTPDQAWDSANKERRSDCWSGTPWTPMAEIARYNVKGM